MIAALLERFRRLRWWWKAPIWSFLALAALAALYVGGRSLQYLGASRAPAGIYAPAEADWVLRCVDGAGTWRRVQDTAAWKVFRRKLQQDTAVRAQMNSLLGALGVPTLDQLDDVRWLESHPAYREESLLRYAGRDVMVALKDTPSGPRICAATRLGWREFLLLPGASIAPGLLGAQRATVGGSSVLKVGRTWIAIQGAVVIVSDDESLLRSALERRGPVAPPKAAVAATGSAKKLKPLLQGYPAGGFLLFADWEKLDRVRVELDVDQGSVVLRARAEGVPPRRSDPAPTDAVHMVPPTGVGTVLYNVDSPAFWAWLKRITDATKPSPGELDRFAREMFGPMVSVLDTNRFEEEVVSRLDGPVSVIFGATEGENGRTYASTALYLRSSDPTGAATALQRIIDRATQDLRDKLRAEDFEVGGCPARAYTYSPDLLGWNNYLAACYAVTGEALIVGNNPRFLKEAMACLANQAPSMSAQKFHEDARRRLQALGLNRVLVAGGTASGFLWGPSIREGLEGFYPILASQAVDNDRFRQALRRELQNDMVQPADLDEMFQRVLNERIGDKERELRAVARALDYFKWAAFQAEPTPDGTGLDLAFVLEVR